MQLVDTYGNTLFVVMHIIQGMVGLEFQTNQLQGSIAPIVKLALLFARPTKTNPIAHALTDLASLNHPAD